MQEEKGNGMKSGLQTPGCLWQLQPTCNSRQSHLPDQWNRPRVQHGACLPFLWLHCYCPHCPCRLHLCRRAEAAPYPPAHQQLELHLQDDRREQAQHNVRRAIHKLTQKCMAPDCSCLLCLTAPVRPPKLVVWWRPFSALLVVGSGIGWFQAVTENH